MRFLDRCLQRWRGRLARPWVPQGACVLDIGCHQGEFLAGLKDHIGPSLGCDPHATPRTTPRYQLLAERFGPGMPWPNHSFDAVLLLATLEHIPNKHAVAAECRRLLRPGGPLILTVPSPRVDRVLAGLQFLQLADGMDLQEHHGFDPWIVPTLFERHGFTLRRHRRFQLCLNHLFVFV